MFKERWQGRGENRRSLLVVRKGFLGEAEKAAGQGVETTEALGTQAGGKALLKMRGLPGAARSERGRQESMCQGTARRLGCVVRLGGSGACSCVRSGSNTSASVLLTKASPGPRGTPDTWWPLSTHPLNTGMSGPRGECVNESLSSAPLKRRDPLQPHGR